MLKIVAYMSAKHKTSCAVYDPTPDHCDCGAHNSIPLVTLANAQEEAKAATVPVLEPLTDDEIERLWVDLPTWGNGQPWHVRFTRAVETAHAAKLAKLNGIRATIKK